MKSLNGMVIVRLFAVVAVILVLAAIGGSFVASLQVNNDAQESFWSLQNYVAVFSDPAFVQVTVNTLIQGIGSVLVMLFFAVPITWLLTLTDFRRKNLVFTLLTVKLAVPTFIVAMSYVFLLNPTSGMVNKLLLNITGEPLFNIYSLFWVCLIQGISLTPACVFMLVPAFQNMDATLEEACKVSGVRFWKTARHITLPILAPAIVASALFFFVISVEIFDVVGVIGLPGGIEVLSIWIYDKLHPTVGLANHGGATATGSILFVLTGLAIFFYVRFLRRSEKFTLVTGKRIQSKPIDLGRFRLAANLFVTCWVLLAVIIPFCTLIWSSFVPYLAPPSAKALQQISLLGYQEAFSYLGEPLKNTLIFMALTILFTLCMTVSCSWLITRSRMRMRSWLDGVIFFSPAIPSMVVAVSLLYTSFKVQQWLPLYGTVWLLVIAMSVRMLAFSTRTLNANAIQFHKELDEAAYTSGVPPFKVLRKVFLPLIMPAVFYSALMVGMLSARELTVPLIIGSSDIPLVSTLIFDLQGLGFYDTAGALSIMFILILVALALVSKWVLDRSQNGMRKSERSEPLKEPHEKEQLPQATNL